MCYFVSDLYIVNWVALAVRCLELRVSNVDFRLFLITDFGKKLCNLKFTASIKQMGAVIEENGINYRWIKLFIWKRGYQEYDTCILIYSEST